MALGEGDRRLLLSFVDQVPSDIGFVIEVGSEYIEPRLYELLRLAWAELRDQNVIEEIADRVRSRDFDLAIERHGLAGAQLRYKLALVDEGREEVRRAGIPRGRILRRFLRKLDVPLGSLLAAIGVGEALKELKEGLELSLPDAG
jgi:hypothetical protein